MSQCEFSESVLEVDISGLCVHCLPRAHAECSKSTSSETDLNDNLPSHRTPTSSTSSAKYTSHNGFFPQHTAPASASSIYDSPPSRGASADSGLYHLPRSYSQDTVLVPKSASSPPAHQDSGDSELYVFNTPSRKTSMETQMRNLSVSYDIPPTPGANSTYQVPRTSSSSTGIGASEGGGDVVPPPRPPKPLLSSSSGLPPPPAERSPTDTYCVPRSASETDGNYCVPTSAGNKALRSNTIGTVDCSRLRKGRCQGEPCFLFQFEEKSEIPNYSVLSLRLVHTARETCPQPLFVPQQPYFLLKHDQRNP